MALQLDSYFLVFQDDGIHRYALDADPHLLPEVTWALSDSNENAIQPCQAFLAAAHRKIAWIVQATSPKEERSKKWQKYHNADTFIMDCFSIDEMTALGLV